MYVLWLAEVVVHECCCGFIGVGVVVVVCMYKVRVVMVVGCWWW